MAVIDRERGYIFFHIPKTAGVSIAAALVEQGGRRIVDDPDLAEPILERKTVHTGRSHKGLVTHVRPRLLREILGPETYETFESAAVVRCPWSRLRSVYHYQRQRPPGRVGPFMSDLIDLSLSDFAIGLCEREYSPIARLLSDREGTLLVDTVLRFETLEADFAQWTERVIGKPAQLPWLNKSRGDKQESFNAAAIAVIRKHFAEDIERFGYSDSPPD